MIIKSLNDDFGGEFNHSQFHDEIVNSLIVTEFDGIISSVDEIQLLFTSELTIDEEVILDGLISNHVPIYRTFEEEFPTINIVFKKSEEFKKQNVPEILSVFNYNGSLKTKDPKNEGYIIHNGRSKSSQYEIEIILRDITNNVDILNVSLTGDGNKNSFKANPTSETELPPLQNLPTEQAMLQLSYRLVEGERGKFYSIVIN